MIKIAISALTLPLWLFLAGLVFASNEWPQALRGEVVEVDGFSKLPKSIVQTEFVQRCLTLDQRGGSCRLVTRFYEPNEDYKFAIIHSISATVVSVVLQLYQGRLYELRFSDLYAENRIHSIDRLGETKVDANTGTLTTLYRSDYCTPKSKLKENVYELNHGLYVLTRVSLKNCMGDTTKIIWEAK